MDDNESLENDGKVKAKLMSMWHNVRYRWNVKLKTNFSKDSPIWLLGKCYHQKCEDGHELQYCQEGNLETKQEGIEGFKVDFFSRLWFTYRKEFPLLSGSNFTSDCGWGCMLRSGQMLLAQALVCHFLGRDWRWYSEQDTGFHRQFSHRKLIRWFGDSPSSYSPFSIHALVSLGEDAGKKAGDWYGPGSVAHLLRQAIELGSRDICELDQLRVYVAQDCAVYRQDIYELCNWGENRCANPVAGRILSKSLILLVPVRLGAVKMNSIYGQCLTSLLTLEQCIGIIGGRPKHSLYFVGYQDDKLIHLDPHYCQEMVDVLDDDFPLSSFHCRSPRKMSVNKLDPSCCIGFYCRDLGSFVHFSECIREYLIPACGEADYPMFVFCEGHSRDCVSAPQFGISEVNRTNDPRLAYSDDELDCGEFEVI
ncbi:cysteine protease ATG4C [Anabrus simplex]|uniref:cysteine protease ATG4C n=1 Tax=Anabrus simplex TaxID=316456 RepID=UPI0035A3B79D